MMLGLGIARALTGALVVAAGDRRGLALFLDGRSGARHAFLAWLYLAPVTAFCAMLAILADPPDVAGLLDYIARAILAEAAAWAALMLLATNVLRRRGNADAGLRFVTVYTWSLVWQTTVTLLALMLLATGLLTGGAGRGMLAGVEIALLLHTWLIARLCIPDQPALAPLLVGARLGLGLLAEAVLLAPYYPRIVATLSGWG